MEILMIILFTMLIIAYVFSYTKERRHFNKGQCLICDKRFSFFDTNSQGNRGYTCRTCGYTVWVSYNSIDKSYFRRDKDV